MNIRPNDLKKKLHIEFIGEEGLDAGFSLYTIINTYYFHLNFEFNKNQYNF